MAGGRMKYRHLGRTSAHRQALLRNLVTSLFTHESISTTWPKAKEAQRLAEKLVTLAKKNTEASKRRALAIFYTPHELLPKLFGPIRERYADRPGGYTRVLRIEPLKEDQAPSAILELIDGPKDMRAAMTARTVARLKEEGKKINEMTQRNIDKVTRYNPDGLTEMMARMQGLGPKERDDVPFDGEGEEDADEGRTKRERTKRERSWSDDEGKHEGKSKRERRWGGFI